MKVVLVNTQTPGGAYVACLRLYNALKKQDVDVSFVAIRAKRRRFLWERFCIWVTNRFSRKNLFAVSIANTGTDISKLPEIREADIIHLHWINHGALSLRNIAQLQALGKPIVWTMHDMWPFTGICHHAYECTNYEKECGQCHLLRYPSDGDLSNAVFEAKRKIYSSIHFVAVSRWLQQKAELSPLVHFVETISNVLDASIFDIQDRQEARRYFALPQDKRIILMGAGNLSAPIKGFHYLREALSYIVNKQNVCLCLFGNVRHNSDFLRNMPVQTIWLNRSFESFELARLYAAADVTVSSSLYETFGQTLSESLACGTPVVSFNKSGQTDIVVHKENGYLARWKDAHDLAKGIAFVLSQGFDRNRLREYAVAHFSEEKVVNQYMELYKSLLNQ